MKTPNHINETGSCSFCGAPYTHYGNNPEPIKPFHLRCCDKCNWEKVIPWRMGKVPGALGTWEDQQQQQEALKEALRGEFLPD
jgi:hypothetical protein